MTYHTIYNNAYKADITNYYSNLLDDKKYDDNIYIEIDECQVLIYRYEKYYKLYYWSHNVDKLIEIINSCLKILKLPVIIECIYKQNIGLADKIVKNVPFLYYGGIIRLQKKVTYNDIENKIDDKNIICAYIEDIEEILKIHTNIFNKYIDRELMHNELLELVNNKNVLLYKINGQTAGCLIYNKRGKFYHLRYWFVNKKLSIKGIGKALLYKLYDIAGKDNFIEVWSRKDNIIVTEIYKKYGFTEDGLNSDIFVYSTESSIIEPLIPLN